jgi:hypothetical protein
LAEVLSYGNVAAIVKVEAFYNAVPPNTGSDQKAAYSTIFIP